MKGYILIVKWVYIRKRGVYKFNWCMFVDWLVECIVLRKVIELVYVMILLKVLKFFIYMFIYLFFEYVDVNVYLIKCEVIE